MIAFYSHVKVAIFILSFLQKAGLYISEPIAHSFEELLLR